VQERCYICGAVDEDTCDCEMDDLTLGAAIEAFQREHVANLIQGGERDSALAESLTDYLPEEE
jgi:hypothetical protein